MSDERKPPSTPGSGEGPWLARARERLESQARDLDAATLSRLTRARAAALAEVARPQRPAWAWPAAFATAFVLVAAVVVWRLPGAPAPVPAALSADDFALITEGEDDLALYEDLEFYAWLDAQQAAGG